MTHQAPARAQPAPARGLLRILGVSFGVAVIVGATLGVGILRSPGLVAAGLPDPRLMLLLWLLGGLYTLLSAICLTELGTMLPQAGGYYVYTRRAFGDAAGLAVGWTDWLTYCSVLAYVSIAIGEFSARLVPAVATSIKAVALATLAFFTILQWRGLEVSRRAQELTSLLKFVAFLGLVVICFLSEGARPSSTLPVTLPGLVTALPAVLITYGGWQSALYFTEEDRDPAKNLPRAMIGGVALVILIYMLVNAALLHVLPLARLMASKLPAADAAEILFGPRGGPIITTLSLISLPPLINAILMIATRILFALGRDGLLLSRMATVNAGGTPAAAMLVTALGAALLALTGTFEKLIALTAFFLAANYSACCLSLLVLRRREPDLPRPFRAWGYPWSAFIVLAGAALYLVSVIATDTRNSLYALGLLAASLPVHALLRQRRAAAP